MNINNESHINLNGSDSSDDLTDPDDPDPYNLLDGYGSDKSDESECSDNSNKMRNLVKTPEVELESDDKKYIQMQYLQLIDKFRNDWEELINRMKKPRVLIAGITGCGKSSIINTIFGNMIANVGVGMPVTQYFQQFEPIDKPIIIIDSKGLECGTDDDFLNTTKDFLENNMLNGTNIDIVWYVINLASARIQPYEHKLLTEIFRDIPVIIILNKADISSDEDIQSMRKVLIDYNLQNLIGIYQTVGDRTRCRITRCLKCGSDHIILMMRTKIIRCDNCETESHLYENSGLNQVIEKTVEHLPEFVRESFISSQFINLKVKEEHSIMLIRNWYIDENDSNYNDLLTRLSSIWNFNNNISVHPKKNMTVLNNRLNILMGMDGASKTISSAIAILWMHCLRRLATIVLDNFLKNVMADDPEIDLDNFTILSFDELNTTNIQMIITMIDTNGIEIALKNEYNDFIEEKTQFQETHKCIMSESHDSLTNCQNDCSLKSLVKNVCSTTSE